MYSATRPLMLLLEMNMFTLSGIDPEFVQMHRGKRTCAHFPHARQIANHTCAGCPKIVNCIGGLVVEYIVAIDVTRVRFPADATKGARDGVQVGGDAH